jgi:hypothetical protein
MILHQVARALFLERKYPYDIRDHRRRWLRYIRHTSWC